MIFRRLFKVFTFVLAILSVNLLSNYIDTYLTGYRSHYNPVQFTLIGMAVILLIFYPLFAYLDKLVESVAEDFLRIGKSMIGRKTGLIFAFLAAFYGLFYLYSVMWFGESIKPNIHQQVWGAIASLWP